MSKKTRRRFTAQEKVAILRLHLLEHVPIKRRKRKTAANVSDGSLPRRRGATTLDNVHVAMCLQASGRANALGALLKAETERGPDFLRLANTPSALDLQGRDGKRLLDAVLLAVPR
jgi:putative DNA methylase